jgi:hypothetical protein
MKAKEGGREGEEKMEAGISSRLTTQSTGEHREM